MADFNPQLPTTEPPNFTSFMYGARQTPEPKVDESGKIAGEGAGRDLENIGKSIAMGARGLDEAFKQNIDSSIHDAVDVQRDAFSKTLADYKDMQTAQQGQSQGNLDGNQQPPVPGAISMGLSKANSMQGALESGKVSETYYWGQMNSLAKQMRSQYVGYRDFIDSEFSKITGHNPANAYMQSLMQDINRTQSSKANFNNKLVDSALSLAKSGVPDAYSHIQQFMQDGNADRLGSFINGANADLYKWKAEKDQAETQMALRTNTKQNNIDIASKSIGDYTDMLSKRTTDHIFTGGGVVSLQDMQSLLQDPKRLAAVPAEQWQNWHMQLQGARTAIVSQAWKEANTADLGKQTLVARAGDPEKIKQAIQGRLESFDAIDNFIMNKDLGAAYFVQRQNNARKADDAMQLADNPVLGQDVRKLTAAKTLGVPDAVIQSMAANHLTQPARLDYLTNTFQLNNLVGATDKDGSPWTFDKGLQTLRTKAQQDDPHSSRYVRDFLNTSTMIADKTLPDQPKLNLVKAAFDPSNGNMLSDGNFSVTDKYRIFNQFTSEGNTQEIARLGKTHPEILPMVKNWAERSFGDQIFDKDLANLESLKEMPWVKLGWNDKTNSVVLLDTSKNSVLKHTSGPVPGERTAFFDLQNTVDRINGGLKSLGNVEAITGGNVSQALTTFLHKKGVDLMSDDAASRLFKAVNAPTDGSGVHLSPLGDLSDPSNRFKYAYEYFTSKGYTPDQASGIVGNLMGETSNLNPQQVHDNGIGYGIAGWNKDRLAGLKDYAVARGTSVSDPDTQLSYIDYELHHNESGAFEKLSQSATPEEAARAMLSYERPKDWDVPGAHNERMKYARQLYNRYASK